MTWRGLLGCHIAFQLLCLLGGETAQCHAITRYFEQWSETGPAALDLQRQRVFQVRGIGTELFQIADGVFVEPHDGNFAAFWLRCNLESYDTPLGDEWFIAHVISPGYSEGIAAVFK